MEHPLKQILLDQRIPFRKKGEHHHCSNPNFIAVDCPWCGQGSGAFHLGISNTLRCRCWRCGKKYIGDVWKELRLQGNWKKISRNFGPAEYKRPTGKFSWPKGICEIKAPQKRWLRSRGLDPETTAELWGLRGTDKRAKRLAWRLVAPVMYGDKPVSWTSRRCGNKGKRWWSATPEEESLPLGSLVYGMEHVTNWAIIVEGPSDCWKIGPGAVACLGLGGLSNSQLLELASIPNRWVLFDDEPRAQAEAAKLCAKLAEFPGNTVRLELEDGYSGRDPGECTYDEVVEIRTLVGCTQEPTWIACSRA